MSKLAVVWLGLSFGLSNVVYAESTTLEEVQLNKNCDNQLFIDAFRCGKFTGKFHTLYYSTHNAFFIPDLNQDTITTGGFIKFETSPYYGLTAGISYAGQRRLDHKVKDKNEVAELKNDKDGLAEVYIDWQKDAWKIRIGQQSLDVPFLGNYDWRIMPPLFRAVDFKYGDEDEFIRTTWVDRFKSYADDEFSKTSRYSQVETDGMWSVGVGKKMNVEQTTFTAQAWHQKYLDYSSVTYLEGHIKQNDVLYKPDFGLQFMHAKGSGNALKEASPDNVVNHRVDHQGFGASLALQPKENLLFKASYNYIKENKDSYLNGSLFVPYMIYTASGPYFAQPFFTSTQDLGSGNAYMVAIEGALNDQAYVGFNYSFMDLKESSNVKSLNQSEYVLYGFYNFNGALEGWSLANFFGVVTSPREDKTFLQNRFGIKYVF